MKQVVGFGELMLRLGPKGHLRFRQAHELEVNYTGAEANVCVSLAMMGAPAKFVTLLPDHAIAYTGVSALRGYGIDVADVKFGGDRMGIFFVEKGASQRASEVIYDRGHTAFIGARPEAFDWKRILADSGYFHFTGITPALGGALPEICLDACRAARELGISVSCDLNFRKKLWTPEQAKAVMEGLLPYVDLCIANEEDCEKVLGIRAENSCIHEGKLDRDGYRQVAGTLCERYGVKSVGITLRESISASDNNWSVMYYTGEKAYFSRRYAIHIVDRVGGGDSFAAGLLYARGHGYDPQRTAEFAAAASCLKHTIEMDFNLSTLAEVERLMQGDGSGRVQR